MSDGERATTKERRQSDQAMAGWEEDTPAAVTSGRRPWREQTCRWHRPAAAPQALLRTGRRVNTTPVWHTADRQKLAVE
jgi:hypothetical protein